MLAGRLVSGAGVGIEILGGILLLRWSRRRRTNSVAAFVALVLGAVALHESTLYVYFSAWSDDARMDAVQVMHTLGDAFDDRTVAWPRWFVVAIAGVAGIAAHWHCVRQLLPRIAAALGDTGEASRVRHLAALAALYVAPVVFSAWYRARGFDPLHQMGPATLSVALAAVLVAVGVVVLGPAPSLAPLNIRRHHFIEGLVLVATFTAGVNFVWCSESPSAVDDEPAFDPIADYALAAKSVGPRAVAALFNPVDRDADRERRIPIALSAMRPWDVEFLPLLTSSLTDIRSVVRRGAAIGLSQLGIDAASAQSQLEGLSESDPSPAVRSAAAAAIAAFRAALERDDGQGPDDGGADAERR